MQAKKKKIHLDTELGGYVFLYRTDCRRQRPLLVIGRTAGVVYSDADDIGQQLDYEIEV